ncbi:MAG: NADP-dependent oxidoreductase [Gammaproteobacteria bacterium]
MKAVRIHTYGGPEVLKLESAPIPSPKAGEILVRIKAAGVNPVDWKIREGYLKDYLKHQLPLILGWDVAGVVEKLGQDVTRFAVGDAIYSRPDINKDGAYAEFMVLNAEEAAQKPESLSFDEAAAVPLAALTAWQALFDEAKLDQGQRVLIHAGAGGVGSFAVQLAKCKNIYVIATASDQSIPLVKSLGADEVIDYRMQDFATLVRDVDVVLDTIGGETQTRSWQCLRPNGILVSTISQPDEKIAKQQGKQGVYMFVQPNGLRLEELAQMIDVGEIKPLIDVILPLQEVVKAQERSASGHAKGKIILHVTD